MGESSVVKFIRLVLKQFLWENNSKKRYYLKKDKNESFISLIIFFDKEIKKFILLDSKVDCTMTNTTLFNIEEFTNKSKELFKETIFPILDYSLTSDSSIHLVLPSEIRNNQFINFPNKSLREIDFIDETKDILEIIFRNYKTLSMTGHWGIFKDFFQPKDVIISFNYEMWSKLYSKKERVLVSYFQDSIKNKVKLNKNFLENMNKDLKSPDKTRGRWEEREKHILMIQELEDYASIFEKLLEKNIFTEVKISSKVHRSRRAYDLLKLDIHELFEINKGIEYILKLSCTEVFKIDIIDKNDKDKTFNNLSFGEQQLLKVLNIIYSLASNDDTEKLLIFLDEIDIGFHPEWQKKVLKYILELTKLLPEKEFHLLFSAHSPFIVSDIPKQNIIFLDKDENGNCKVINGLKEKKQTFGANIHTLLSDSFFMEDGLMGEFAKAKIDKAIELLNQEQLNEDELKYCEQIISIIGEPIVKNQLERMLHHKKVDYLAKDTREEIEFLKHRIDLLSKRL